MTYQGQTQFKDLLVYNFAIGIVTIGIIIFAPLFFSLVVKIKNMLIFAK